jgi:hypothetical protein
MPTDLYAPYRSPNYIAPRSRIFGWLALSIGLLIWATMMIAIAVMAGVAPS